MLNHQDFSILRKAKMPDFKYYIIYKPYLMLSQFSREGNHAVLGDLYDFPKDVYPVGRLDSDSEGLLILTNDNHLKHQLLEPKFAHEREYLVQVEGIPDETDLEQIRKGVIIRINKKDYKTLPAKVELITEPKNIPERTPPVRFRQSIPTSWLKLVLTEGKNRQVRRMTAKIGFPTLRLIRYRIEKLHLGNMKDAEVKVLNKEEIYSLVLKNKP